MTDESTELDQIAKLQETIQTLELQRAILGDLTVDAAQEGLRLKIEALQEQRRPEVEETGERKLATCLFCDVVGFTTLSSERDPEEVVAILNGALGRISEAIHRFGGAVNRFMGDGVFALFGVPRSYEDHAERAIRAGLAIQASVAAYARQVEAAYGIREFRVRVGINSGLVVTGRLGGESGEYTAIGDVVNVASRLESAAEPGTVLISEDAYRLAGPLFLVRASERLTLRGKAEAQQAYEVLGLAVVPGRLRGISGLSSPLVGREAERVALVDCVERLAREGQGGVVCLFGEAGLGKSRLVEEVRVSEGGEAVSWLEGQSPSYGGEAFGLWLDLLRRYLHLGEEEDAAAIWSRLRTSIMALCPAKAAEVLPYLASLYRLPVRGELEEKVRHLDPQSLQRQIFWAVRVILEALAAARPLVLVVEDLHWADRASLDLLAYLWDLAWQAPVLLIGISRPEQEGGGLWLRARAEEDARCVAVDLHPLSADDSALLVGNLLEVEALPPWLQAAVLSRAEGNPFFVEELIRTLIDQGALTQGEGGWRIVADAGLHELPDTLHNVLVSRIDRLDREAKALLQMAAVMGRTFGRRVLAHLWGDRQALLENLAGLQQSDLIRESENQVAAEKLYAFKHALVQEAAYGTLLRGRRVEIHRRVASALETVYAHRLEEFYALLAYHFAQAGEREQALDYLVRAGDQSRAVYANQEAIGFYQQALEMAEAAGRRVELLHNLGEILYLVGEYDRADAFFRHALDLLAVSSMPVLDGVRLVAESWRQLARTHEAVGKYDESLACLTRGLDALGAGDAWPEVRADLLNYVGWVQMRQSRYKEAVMSCQGALNLALEAGRDDLVADAYRYLGVIYDYQGDYDQAIAFHHRSLALREAMGDRALIASACNSLGIVFDEKGNRESALAYYERAFQICQEIGHRLGQAMLANNIGIILFHQERGEESIKLCNQALEICLELGHLSGVVMARNNLGLAYRAVGNLDDALEQLSRARDLANSVNDQVGLLTAYGHLAELYLTSGGLELALEYGSRGLALAKEVGFRLAEADAQDCLAQIQARAGEADLARRHWEKAQAIFVDLGNQTMVQQVKKALAELASQTGGSSG